MVLEDVDRQFASDDGAELWELFHENSKTSRHERHATFTLHPSDEAIVRVMDHLRRVKPYRDHPKVTLPEELPPSRRSLDELVAGRETARSFGGGAIPFTTLAKMLRGSYGLTRDNAGTHFPRPFRAVPSGGALYPLELYAAVRNVDGLDPGLYHYDAEDHTLDVLGTGDPLDGRIADLFVQEDLVSGASVVIFVAAVFYRTTFKYGPRGYRFVLLEAGHLAQNAMLIAQDQDCAAAVVGGYFDRDVDRFLGFDGVDQSVVYVLLAGTP